MHWTRLFGTHSGNAGRGKEWLSSLTPTQLCAVYVIGRALKSVNIPYIVATMLNPRDVKSFAKEVHGCYPFVEAEDLTRYFENYLFFFTLENLTEKMHMWHSQQSAEAYAVTLAAKRNH